jgi:hypothetical protein
MQIASDGGAPWIRGNVAVYIGVRTAAKYRGRAACTFFGKIGKAPRNQKPNQENDRGRFCFKILPEITQRAD